MKQDYLKQFISLQESLIQEKAELEARLKEINRALGHATAAATRRTRTARKQGDEESAPARGRGRRAAVKRAKNELSLRDAVRQVTTGKTLSKQEILEAVQKLGYVFATGNPMGSLNTVLYGKGSVKFKNVDGKFTLAS